MEKYFYMFAHNFCGFIFFLSEIQMCSQCSFFQLYGSRKCGLSYVFELIYNYQNYGNYQLRCNNMVEEEWLSDYLRN